jgi:hypothetical protein
MIYWEGRIRNLKQMRMGFALRPSCDSTAIYVKSLKCQGVGDTLPSTGVRYDCGLESSKIPHDF